MLSDLKETSDDGVHIYVTKPLHVVGGVKIVVSGIVRAPDIGLTVKIAPQRDSLRQGIRRRQKSQSYSDGGENTAPVPTKRNTASPQEANILRRPYYLSSAMRQGSTNWNKHRYAVTQLPHAIVDDVSYLCLVLESGVEVQIGFNNGQCCTM